MFDYRSAAGSVEAKGTDGFLGVLSPAEERMIAAAFYHGGTPLAKFL